MTRIYVDLVGGPAAIERRTGISQRAGNARPAFEEILHVLEQGEKRVFRGGKYVRSGDLKKSLTQPHGNDAIRAAHSDGQGLTFGTAIWYAHFQKTSDGKSAVLRLQPKERKASVKVLMDWLTRGVPA